MKKHSLKLFVLIFCILLDTGGILSSGLHTIADDPGLGWHLQTGLYILHHYALPDPEPFLSLQTETPIVVYQWLSDLLLAVIYETTSWVGLYAGLISFNTILVWSSLFIMALYLSESFLLSLALTMITSELIGIHLILRPVLFQMIFFCCTAFLILMLRRRIQDGESVKVADYGLSFFLLLLWANLHPSFLLGLLLLGIPIVSMILDSILFKQPFDRRIFVSLCTLELTALIASLVNPFGINLHRFIARYMTESHLRVQSEWLPPAPDSTEFFLFLTLCFFTIGMIVLCGKERRRIGTAPLLLMIPFMYMGFTVVRYIPIASIAMMLIAALYSRRVLARVYPRLLESEIHRQFLQKGALISTATVIAIITFYSAWFKSIPFYSGSYGPSQATFPYQSLKWLRTNVTQGGSPLILLTHPNWGGFFVLHGYPEIKPTIDDRFYLLPENYTKAFMQFLRAPDIESLRVLTRHRFDLAAFPLDSKASNFLKNTFPEAHQYEDSNTVVFDNSIRPRQK